MFLHLSHCGPSLCLMLVRLIWFGVDKDSAQKSMGVPYSVGICYGVEKREFTVAY